MIADWHLILEISFLSKELRRICEIRSEADEKLGVTASTALRTRLSDLFAVDRYDELPIGNARIRFIELAECVIIDIKDGLVMHLSSGHVSTPKNVDGTNDWTRINRLKLIFIGVKDDSL
ncbi:hypothetical protein H5123_11010 [Shewanella sp. SR43-4]|uniref:hypothetical protein n=1 Tax=Shewanella sp. SR43-4 TaxID=2760942 RepID=UPI0015FD7094|nr:hypothetical protein [Shewanella sp. SR43-4]MBB1318163.1 hypothetical protein [Shewanella sp. SR43-4]